MFYLDIKVPEESSLIQLPDSFGELVGINWLDQQSIIVAFKTGHVSVVSAGKDLVSTLESLCLADTSKAEVQLILIQLYQLNFI